MKHEGNVVGRWTPENGEGHVGTCSCGWESEWCDAEGIAGAKLGTHVQAAGAK